MNVEVTIKMWKNHCDLPCAKRPLLDFQIWEKHLSLFYLRSGFMFSCKSQSHRVAENFEKSTKCRRTYARFPKIDWKHLQNFSQLRKSKKVIEVEKDRSASNEKCLITVRQGMWYMHVGLIEKWVKDLKSARTGFTGTFKILFREKLQSFIYFLCRSCWFARTYWSMKRAKQMKWEFEFEQ